MSLLIETISCIDGKLQNLFWHTSRVNKSRSILFNSTNKLSLEKTPLPDFVQEGLWKCRVLYDGKINGVSFEPYVAKKVKTFKLIESDITYSHKFEDRRAIDELFQQKGDADEIIVVKNGLVTDTSIANILLFDGRNWITPDYPLLEGTMRAELISKKVVKPQPVKASDLAKYKKIMLINAMNPFNESIAINIAQAIVN
ncbi:MAG: aminotransferase class IV family protein [Cyclobacteriaceae bacterium]|nr:aminotransferase class IV family protein [Cyclobacteriaceae bacterium]